MEDDNRHGMFGMSLLCSGYLTGSLSCFVIVLPTDPTS